MPLAQRHLRVAELGVQPRNSASAHTQLFFEAGGWPAHSLCHRGKPECLPSISFHTQVFHSGSSDLGLFLTEDMDHRKWDIGYSLNCDTYRTLTVPSYFIATLTTSRKKGHNMHEHLCSTNCVYSCEKLGMESWGPYSERNRARVWL